MPVGPNTRLVDERLATALSHSIREDALAIFQEGPASTKEVAEKLKVEVNYAWYHVNKLYELACIKEVDSQPRRGATERYFVATTDCFFDEESWRAVSRSKRSKITMRILRLISQNLHEALLAGTVDLPGRHLSRTVLDLDGIGEADARAVLKEALERLLAIRRESGERRAETGEEPTRHVAAMIEFELPQKGD